MLMEITLTFTIAGLIFLAVLIWLRIASNREIGTLRKNVASLILKLDEKESRILRLEEVEKLYRLEVERNIESIASLLRLSGCKSDIGERARAALGRLGCEYEYSEEKGHWEESQVLVKGGMRCIAQDSQGTCWVGCRDGELCADAVYNSTRNWIIDVPREVRVISK